MTPGEAAAIVDEVFGHMESDWAGVSSYEIDRSRIQAAQAMALDALKRGERPAPDVERIAARHREPHKCPREDPSSACDFNRYGAPAIRALSGRVG